LKKTSLRTLSVLLALFILLQLAAPWIPNISTAPLVEAASSATITLDMSQGYVGDYVTVTGRGFTPDKDVTFMWGDQLFSSLSFIVNMPYYQRPSIQPWSLLAQVHTDALGNFIVKLQVPKLTRGAYTIKASDTETSALASFTINPRIFLRNNYAYEKHGKSATPEEFTSSQFYIGLFLAEGFVGDWLSVQLSGFARGEMVQVNMSTTTLDDFIVGTTLEGYFFATWVVRVPDLLGGEKTVTATGKLSGITASGTFMIKPELFLARPPPMLPPPPGLEMGYPWLYSSATVGLAWYSSVNTAVDSPFVFEATGLTGTSIQSVTVTYTGGTVACTLSGTLTIQTGRGSTQGISTSTVPFTSNSPFGPNSPEAEISAALTSGAWLNVTVVTTGTGGATFTFTKQLFASAAATADNVGIPFWIESDGTITTGGTRLSGASGDMGELAEAGLKAGASYWLSIIYPSGSTVRKFDFDILIGPVSLAWFDQGTTPLAFYDANGNGAWDVGEDVYYDHDNSGTVSIGPPADIRVNTVNAGATTYFAGSTVAAGNADVGRTLVDYEVGKGRPAHLGFGPYTGTQAVYLDKDNDASISQGDTRISVYRFTPGSILPDANGFFAIGLGIPPFPGGGLEYNFGLWNFGASPYGVLAGTAIILQVQAYLAIGSAPVSYQKQWYVTEGSDVFVYGNSFRSDEQLTISVGGKYVATVAPDITGSFGTWITMPALAGGEKSITATGVITTSNTASTPVTFTPAISVTPTSGYNLNPLTSIMVTGKGFEVGTYQIVFDGAGIGESVTSAFTVADTGDLAGQINIAFNLPAGVEGDHIVDVVKTSDPSKSVLYGAGYLTWAGAVRLDAPFPTDSEFRTVGILPSLQVSPTTTVVGTSIMVAGKGLLPSTAYYIWYDPRGNATSQAVLMTTTPANVTTDAKGNLVASFQLPQSSGGGHFIWVSTSNTFINIDSELGGTVFTWVSIRQAMTLAQSSGTIGSSIAVSFTGLYPGSQYQLWWYKPNEPKFAGEIPSTALLLVSVTGAMYGNSTVAVSFTVPATAEVNTVYAVDLSTYGNRYTTLGEPVFFTVGKVSTKIKLSLTPTPVTQGESVAVNVFIEPAMAVNITLYITDPDGTPTNKTVTSTTSGTTVYSFKPDKAGTWQVTARWDGDTVYAAYTSPAETVTVKPIDISWTYALTGLGIGIAALVLGLIITLYYFMRKRRVAPSTAAPPTAQTAPKA